MSEEQLMNTMYINISLIFALICAHRPLPLVLATGESGPVFTKHLS